MKEHEINMKLLASKKPFDAYQLTEVQYALTEIEYDLTSIEYDNTSLEYKIDEINNYIAYIEEQIKEVQSSWETLQNATAANTSGSPKSEFTLFDIEQATVEAQLQIDNWTSAMNKAVIQANEIYKKSSEITENSRKYVSQLKATD